MKRLLMLVVAGTFSLSAAAYACDGMKNAAKPAKSEKVAKKEAPKKDAKQPTKS
jgi:hypothetical protein